MAKAKLVKICGKTSVMPRKNAINLFFILFTPIIQQQPTFLMWAVIRFNYFSLYLTNSFTLLMLLPEGLDEDSLLKSL